MEIAFRTDSHRGMSRSSRSRTGSTPFRLTARLIGAWRAVSGAETMRATRQCVGNFRHSLRLRPAYAPSNSPSHGGIRTVKWLRWILLPSPYGSPTKPPRYVGEFPPPCSTRQPLRLTPWLSCSDPSGLVTVAAITNFAAVPAHKLVECRTAFRLVVSQYLREVVHSEAGIL